MVQSCTPMRHLTSQVWVLMILWLIRKVFDVGGEIRNHWQQQHFHPNSACSCVWMINQANRLTEWVRASFPKRALCVTWHFPDLSAQFLSFEKIKAACTRSENNPEPSKPQTFAEEKCLNSSSSTFPEKCVQHNVFFFFFTAAPNGGDLQNMFSKMGP